MLRRPIFVLCTITLVLAACGTPVAPKAGPTSAPAATQSPTLTPAPSREPSPAPTNAPGATNTPAAQKGAEVAKVSDDMIRNKLAAANTQFGFKLLNEL